VDRYDVRMGQLGKRLGFAEQPKPWLAPGSFGHPRMQELEGDGSVQSRIMGGIHDAHTPRAESPQNDVMPDQCAAR
jgi:hypothetical protein